MTLSHAPRALGFGLLVFVSVVAAPCPAEAAEPVLLAQDFGESLWRAYVWLKGHGDKEVGAATPAGTATTPPTAHEPDPPAIWLGTRTQVGLVARDWGGAIQLAGGPLALTDAIRFSRSSRMVLSRVRLDGGRLAPFAQLGFGEWRVDPALFHVLPKDRETAVHAGIGVELRVAAGWRTAIEVDWTVLYRDQRVPESMPTPHVWSVFAATQRRF